MTTTTTMITTMIDDDDEVTMLVINEMVMTQTKTLMRTVTIKQKAL